MNKSELKTPGGPSHRRVLHNIEISFPELNWVLTVNITEKSPSASSGGWGCENHFEI